MTIPKDELDRLHKELDEALTCERHPEHAERLRLAIWHWLDDRRILKEKPCG